MNVLMVNKFYYLKGGAERYFFNLIKLLEESGHKIIPMAMKHEENFKTEYDKYFVSEIVTRPNWNIFKNLKTVGRFWWSREARRKIKKLISEEKIDIVHIHNIYHQISPSILPVLKKAGIPIVMTVHDYALISTANYNLYKFKKMNKKIVQRLICGIERFLHHNILNIYRKNIDVFIAPSEFVKNKLIEAGYDKKKIKIIPHFIQENQGSKCQESKIKIKEKYILYFGRLSEEKGVGVLLKAMAKLPEIKLKIVGDGPEKKKLEIRNKKLGNKNVKFLEQKNKDELNNLIINSECVVVPSLAPETFGLTVLETLVLGKCVVASKIGALPELLASLSMSRSGAEKEFLFEPGNVDALAEKIKMLTKGEKCVTIKDQKSREKWLEKYGKKAHYSAILAIYKELLAK